MNKQQGFSVIVAIIIILVVIAGVLYVYQKNPTLMPAPVTDNSIPTDWQTYRNEEYGFEFRYPKNVFAEEFDGGVAISWSSSTAEKPSLSVSVEKHGLSSSRLGLIQQTDPQDVESVIIGGRVAEKFDPVITFAGGKIFIVPIDDKSYLEIHDNGASFESEGFLDQILSTFKFTK